jgi:hypothetical protein
VKAKQCSSLHQDTRAVSQLFTQLEPIVSIIGCVCTDEGKPAAHEPVTIIEFTYVSECF